jgi:hypothetical protein
LHGADTSLVEIRTTFSESSQDKDGGRKEHFEVKYTKRLGRSEDALVAFYQA